MKPTLRLALLLSFIFAATFNISYSQISIPSSTGYSVDIDIEPISLVIHGNGNGNNCDSGYYYDVEMNYMITFNGNNAPKSLTTLQGSITNGADTLVFQVPQKSGTGTTRTNSHIWRGVNDCATATIATMNFKSMTIAVAGEGIDYQVVTYFFPVILPVKMVSFTVYQEKKKVKLNWQTATEINNDYFTIERSSNGNDWITLGKMKAAGNSSALRNYVAYDESPLTGTAHYRIKQTDLDGHTSFSETRSVKVLANSSSISLFPVPNAGNTITILGITSYRDHELSVINSAGSMIVSTALSHATVNLPPLVKGIYFIRIKDKLSGEATTLRYVKL